MIPAVQRSRHVVAYRIQAVGGQQRRWQLACFTQLEPNSIFLAMRNARNLKLDISYHRILPNIVTPLGSARI